MKLGDPVILVDTIANDVQYISEQKAVNFIGVVESCRECGADMAIQTYEVEPTREEIQSLRDSIGGMYCIRERVFKRNEENEWEEME